MVAANLQQVGYYGSTPSNLNATPGAAISGFVRISTSCDEEDAADDSGTPQSRASPLIDLSPRSCGTPMSSGSKRTAGSTRSTASSPGKKPKNAAVRSMNTNMTRFNSSYGHRTEVIENIWFKKNMSVEQKMSMKQQEKESRKQKQQTRKEEQKLVVQSAKELGVHQMATKLWKGVINICKDDDARTIFLMTPSEQRVAMIEDYAAMDINAPVHHEVDATTDSEEEWWDEFVSMVLLDDDEAPFIYAMYEYATHVDTCEQVLQ